MSLSGAIGWSVVLSIFPCFMLTIIRTSQTTNKPTYHIGSEFSWNKRLVGEENFLGFVL